MAFVTAGSSDAREAAAKGFTRLSLSAILSNQVQLLLSGPLVAVLAEIG